MTSARQITSIITQKKIPVYTTLEFFRTKQSIDSFEIKYPKSILCVRQAIKEALDEIDVLVRELTWKYINGAESLESYTREKMISLSYLLTETQIQGIYRKYDFEYVCDMAGSASNITDHIKKVKSISDEISHYSPNEFMGIIEKFEKILHCTEKYMRSFYRASLTETTSHYLESAGIYEQKRKQISDEVKEKLKQIFHLSSMFNHQGIKMTNLSEKSCQLGWKTKCVDVPPLLLFPENCFLIQECKELIESWIKLDKEYPENIRTDIEQVIFDRKELQINRRQEFENFVRKRHKYDLIRQQFDKEKQKEQAINQKRGATEDEHTRITIEFSQSEGDLEILNIPIDAVKQQIEELGKLPELIVQLTRHLSKKERIKEKLKELSTKLQHLDTRLENYSNYYKNLRQLQKDVEKCQLETMKQQRLLLDIDEKFTKLGQVLRQLQTILMLKTTNATLKKIFYNLDFENRLKFVADTVDASKPEKSLPNEASNEANKQMDLTTAIRVASHMLGNDWRSLYFNLPFHPPRGSKQLENDVAKFTQQQVRGLVEDIALQSLNQWRRFHTRSNLACLMTTLDQINRGDIVDKIGRPAEENTQKLIRRSIDTRPAQKSATTRFLLKYYPHLNSNISEDNEKATPVLASSIP